MTSWKRSVLVGTLLGIAITAPVRANDDDNKRRNVTVSFGAGLNTAGAANHHIIPQEIRIKKGDVVNFVVGGFHQIFVYNPGTTPDDIAAYIILNNLGAALFINNLDNLMYMGINPSRIVSGVFFPAGNDPDLLPGSPPTDGSLPGIPPFSPVRSGLQNRVESVAFNEPGTYLVICNVRPHFQDGMILWVKVKDEDDDEDN